MNDDAVIESIKQAILRSVPDGVVGEHHALIYAKAAFEAVLSPDILEYLEIGA